MPKTKKRIDKNKKDKSNKILLVIFLILCVVVFVLATIMITKNAEYKRNKYDIEIPITEEELEDTINIQVNMDDMKKNQSKEYRIKAVNYIDDKVNTKGIKYQIKVSLPNKDSKIDIELYSSNEEYELLKEKKKVTDLRLTGNKKTETTYTFKLIQRQEPIKGESVKIVFLKDK